VRRLRIVIWLATAVFIALLFAPLVAEMYMRLRTPIDQTVLP
jgi:hypothetical protein